MGFALSVLFFVTYYFTPAVVFGPLAEYRVELILAALILIVSLPRLPGSLVLKTPQSLSLIGLGVAVLASIAVGVHWFGGGVQAFLLFIPNTYGYFLVSLHGNSKKKLQVLVVVLLFVCLFVIVHGGIALRYGADAADAVHGDSGNSEYLLAMQNNAGEWFYRLRGLGEINDPNDFGQVIVCTIPLLFLFWRPKKTASNLIRVILPLGVLVVGVFLTHSRGALVALTAVSVVAARRRIGTIPALLLAGGLFAASIALHFTGGRDISASAGEDRTALWGDSLQLLKSHPLFGVGFNQLAGYLGHTAHNTVAVCAAELGLFGLFFWSMFLFPTLRDIVLVSSPEKLTEGGPVLAKEEVLPLTGKSEEDIDRTEISRMGRLVLLSLVGFLVAGWFLSRAFVMTLFLLGGMAEVVYTLALERNMVVPRLRLGRVIPYSGGLAIALVLTIYIMLRVVNLTH